MFFKKSPNESTGEVLQSTWLVEFNHSRRDEPLGFTSGRQLRFTQKVVDRFAGCLVGQVNAESPGARSRSLVVKLQEK